MTDATTQTERLRRQIADRDQRIADIRRSLELLHSPGSVFAIRVLNIPGRNGYTYEASGYFDDFDKAAKAAYEYDQRNAGGVYCTVNPVKPQLLARSANVMVDRPKCTTKDEEIEKRTTLFIDIDTSQEKGIMANDAECAVALELSVHIDDRLRSEGFPYSRLAFSGNGRYVLPRIDLPHDEDTLALLKAFYGSLNEAIGTYDPSKTAWHG